MNYKLLKKIEDENKIKKLIDMIKVSDINKKIDLEYRLYDASAQYFKDYGVYFINKSNKPYDRKSD